MRDGSGRDLPVAMLNYYAARLVGIGKHAGAREGQKLKAKARRRGTWGKVTRRRRLAVARRLQAAKRGGAR